MHRYRVLVALGTIVVTAALTAGALAGDNESGFNSPQPSMLAPVLAGATVDSLLTVGETLPGGYRVESILDGIAFKARGNGRVDVWVNHETSLVPFPVRGVNNAPTTRHDYTNSLVSHLVINQKSHGVLHASLAIPSSANYQRFCSSFLAGAEHGFERELLLTNEEAQDWVRRTGVAWDGTGTEPNGFFAPGAPGTEQAGVVVAYDIKKKEYRSIYGMGRHNHENSVAIPGYGHPVVLSGDDTFTSNPPNSQLYMYEANSADDVWNDRGALYAFVPDNQAKANYNDVLTTDDLTGWFRPVPSHIASGKDPATGAELTSAILPVPGTPPTGTPNGPQWLLDQWGNKANNDIVDADGRDVFDFVRIEDIAYDRNDPHVVYLADSGRGSGTTAPNGRIWRMELDATNPRRVVSLRVLLQGTAATGNPAEIHQPDNLETTETHLYIQEDPSTNNTFASGTGTTARIWRYDLTAGAGAVPEVVARVDQPVEAGVNWGTWESSGIIDASSVFGPGAFLVTIQAPSLSLDLRVLVPDGGGDADTLDDAIIEREGGQLVLLRVPS